MPVYDKCSFQSKERYISLRCKGSPCTLLRFGIIFGEFRWPSAWGNIQEGAGEGGQVCFHYSYKSNPPSTVMTTKTSGTLITL